MQVTREFKSWETSSWIIAIGGVSATRAMVIVGAPLSTQFCRHLQLLRQTSSSSRLLCSLSSSQKIEGSEVKKEDDGFLQWLQKKAGTEVSSVLSLGTTNFGKALFASKPIRAGDCMMKVPYNVQMSVDNLPSEIISLIPNEIDCESRLAVVLMAHQNLGQKSEWAPYINILPCLDEMHNAILWSEEELQMIQLSSVYKETIRRKTQLQNEFSAIKPVIEKYHDVFGDPQLINFMHACSLVTSRAWESLKGGVAMIPYADLINHDGECGAILQINPKKERAEVIADRSYSIGEEVWIRYGRFSNSKLILDFGFSIPHNIFDQARIWMTVPLDDPLYTEKSQIVCEKLFVKRKDNDESREGSFIIKPVKSCRGKIKGISPVLRAFARVASAESVEELEEMVLEASRSDGRLARSSLKNKEREIQAHRMLLHHFDQIIYLHHSSIQEVESISVGDNGSMIHPVRREMARDLLSGEIRVLQFARAWLSSYCEKSIFTPV